MNGFELVLGDFMAVSSKWGLCSGLTPFRKRVQVYAWVSYPEVQKSVANAVIGNDAATARVSQNRGCLAICVFWIEFFFCLWSDMIMQ